MSNVRVAVFIAFVVLLWSFASAQTNLLTNFAGGGPTGVPASQANLYYPEWVATDAFGNYYITAEDASNIFKVNSQGVLTIIAGNGGFGYSGDGGLATNAELDYPWQITVDSAGNIFIADEDNYVVRLVNQTTGLISTVAGIPQSYGYTGDGVPATSTRLYYPDGVAVDAQGDLFISDAYNYRVREVPCADPAISCTPKNGMLAGYIYTIAGTGADCSSYPCGDGGPAVDAALGYTYSIAIDSAGTVILDDESDGVIRLFTPGGNIQTIAGSYGVTCGQSASNACGDGGPASAAQFNSPTAAIPDAAGDLFIADTYNETVREIYCADSAITSCSSPNAGNIYTVAGIGGSYCSGPISSCGDGGSATGATLGYVYGLALDPAGDLFIPDEDNLAVREVVNGTINTVAGNGQYSYSGNNIPATDAALSYPTAVAFDGAGNAYIADEDNYVVRKVDTKGNITTFAGTPGVSGYGGDSGPATSALLSYLSGVAVDSAGNVFIADYYNCIIRMVSAGTGNISTFAGIPGSCTSGGDGGPATAASLKYPYGVAVDSGGTVFIADTGNQVIRAVSGGIINTVAGNGNSGYSGDGVAATSSQLNYPGAVALDTQGNLYIADSNNNRVRIVYCADSALSCTPPGGTTAGYIYTVAGNGNNGYEGDGVSATSTSLYYPSGVALDQSGDLLIGDEDNYRVRLVGTNGIIYTLAGNGTGGNLGQGIVATQAELYDPQGVAVDAAGTVYIADSENNLVRKVSSFPQLIPSRTNIQFDVERVGRKGEQTITLQATAATTVTSIILSAPAFSQKNDCHTLAAGGTCTLDVYFAPQQGSTYSGTITIGYSNAYSNLVINLAGTGTAVTVTPASLAFGPQKGGTSAAKAVTLTNHGSSSLTMGNVLAVGDYLIPNNGNGCTGTILAGGSCTISVEFQPTQNGLRTGSLIINNSDGASPQIVSLIGTGIMTVLSATQVTFPPTHVGTTSAAKRITLTNNDANSMTFTTGFSGANSGDFSFGTGTNACASPLAGNSSCIFYVRFTPAATGPAGPATFTVSGAFGSPSLILKGTGECPSIANVEPCQ